MSGIDIWDAAASGAIDLVQDYIAAHGDPNGKAQSCKIVVALPFLSSELFAENVLVDLQPRTAPTTPHCTMLRGQGTTVSSRLCYEEGPG